MNFWKINSDSIEKKEEIINKKSEMIVVVIMAIIFAVALRYTQMEEIVRVFYLNEECMGKFYVLLVFSFLVSVVWIAFFLWIVFESGRWHTEKNVFFVKHFILYFAIQLFVLLLVWPGIFKDDEIYLVGYGIANINVKWEQSFITQLHYLTALTILPYIFSITLLQITVVSIFEAKIMERISNTLSNKCYAYFMLCVFLLFPVLDNNQFNLRNSIIAWILLYLIISIYCEYKCYHCFSNKCICESLFWAIFVGVWKTEFLYLLPCICLFFMINRQVKHAKYLAMAKYLVGIVVCYFVLTIPNRFFEPANNYLLTPIFTPVSQIVATHYGDFDDAVKEELEVIDAFIPLDVIRDECAYMNLPGCFWNAPTLSRTEKWRVFKSCVSICKYYWKDYMSNRIYIYRWTNGFIPNVINHNASVNGNAHLIDVDGQDLYNYHFKYTHLLNDEIRTAVIKLLACRTKENYTQTNIMYPILYNSFICVLLLCMMSIFFIIRKRWLEVELVAIVLLQVPIIFMLAPAAFFMYYMPFYLSGLGLVLYVLVSVLDFRHRKK